MKKGGGSYTAEVVACYRAVESLKPSPRRVCFDPLAIHFLPRRYRFLCKFPLLARAAFWLLAERGYSGDVAQGIARTRYIDDYVRQCLDEGIEQLVILGAGYDSRAYRMDGLRENIRVFEVDHPATQKFKIEVVRRVLESLPENVAYVPVDFNRESLAKRLSESGYLNDRATLFIWEGVTYFLTAKAVDDTLAFVRSNHASGTSIIFDYTFESVIDGTYPSDEVRRVREVLDRIGEPYTFGVEEGTIADFLAERGFCNVVDVTPDSLTERYFRLSSPNRQVAPFLPLVHANVAKGI